VPRKDVPKGYDFADAEIDGWTRATFRDAMRRSPGVLQDVTKALDFSQSTTDVQEEAKDNVQEEAKDDVQEGARDEVQEEAEEPFLEQCLSGMKGHYESDDEGIWKVESGMDRRKKHPVEERIWICGPIKVLGLVRDEKGLDWGRVIEVCDPDRSHGVL
jgi:hypothetical protein